MHFQQLYVSKHKYSIVHLQANVSHLSITLIKDYDTGGWAHLNVKLLHFHFLLPAPPPPPGRDYPLAGGREKNAGKIDFPVCYNIPFGAKTNMLGDHQI